MQRAFLVGIDVVEECLDIGAVGETTFLEAFNQSFAAGIMPAALAHVIVPDFGFLVGRFPAVRETPLQNIFVGAALFDARDDVLVCDMEKTAATTVKTFAEVFVVIG